ncbi:hypothetical protein ELQ92_14375 [Labedella populi]|uniref:Uncharacterized protein n=1 Tax=Labedella populi TaxID=2498850 RepID=A0A3S4DXI8_9MICO|nr:hypothetical protein [Labedella populi]RWZ58485.1 hypothetical protein ELQ92_14375 [Labedella populi]
MDILTTIISLVITAAIAIPLVIAAVFATQLLRIARTRRNPRRTVEDDPHEDDPHEDLDEKG